MKTKTVLVITLLLVAPLISSVLAAGDVLLASVEAETLTGTDDWGQKISDHATSPSQYGSYVANCRDGDGCLVSDPTTTGDSAEYTFTWEKGSAHYIVIKHLDGFADDSFTVEALHANGAWILLGSYSDQHSTENWVETSFSLSSLVAKGGGTLTIRITLTGPHWSGYSTWGQLAIDYMELYGNGQPR
jgi:hypothetical protein